MSLTSQLKGMEAKFAEQAARAKAEGGYQNLPDTTYTARLTKAEISEGQTLRLKMVFVVLEGEHEGATVTKSDGLEATEDSLYYTARLLGRFGFDPEEINPLSKKLPGILAELTKSKPVCQIALRTKNDFQNVYVNKVLDDYEGGEDEDGDEDDGTITEGTRVTFTLKTGEADAGEVVEVVDENTLRVKKDSDGKVARLKVENVEIESSDEEEDDDSDEDEDDDEAATVEVGMRVAAQWKGSEETGEVVELVDGGAKVKIKKDSDGKAFTVALDKVELLDDDETDEEDDSDEDEDEEEPEPVKRKPGRPSNAAKEAAATAAKKPVTATKPTTATKPAARTATRRAAK